MMRLVVFSSVTRQMIHRPPQLHMEHMEPEAVPMFFKFGLSFSRNGEWGGGRTNQPNQPYGDDLPETCRERLLNCQAVDMHGHGALVAFWWTKFCIY